jgi:hypothetical protein
MLNFGRNAMGIARPAGVTAAIVGLAINVLLLPIAEGADADAPIIQVGLKGDQTPIKLYGGVTQSDDGTLNLPAGEPWGWIVVGSDEKPLPQLEGLRSLTICGWARPVTLAAGSGGNRLAFNLNYNRAGFDLVHLDDGRLRPAINQWPAVRRRGQRPREDRRHERHVRNRGGFRCAERAGKDNTHHPGSRRQW